jgi:hypothetical protein
MPNNKFKLKMGGVVAILASTLTFSPAADAINLVIDNSLGNSISGSANAGQSFINDPSGSGSLINLNTWTFSFEDAANQTTALSSVLTIFTGTGNGGVAVGTSNSAANSTFDQGNSVIWTFAGGLQLTDTTTYSAVLTPFLNYRANFDFSGNPNPAYANGVLTIDAFPIDNSDTVFEATFSNPTAVPFDFDPSFGVLLLGGAWAGNRALKKFKASRNLDLTQQKKD